MSENKSKKLPDLGEIADMAGKLFSDIKKSVSEIVEDYQTKHREEEAAEPKEVKAEEAPKQNEDKPEPEQSEDKPKPTDPEKKDDN